MSSLQKLYQLITDYFFILLSVVEVVILVIILFLWQETHWLLTLHDVDTKQFMGFVAAIGSMQFAIYQLSETRKWNRRHASHIACHEFFAHPPTKESWGLIYQPIFDEEKKYIDLTKEQQEKVQNMLFFFENLAFSMKHKIVEERMTSAYFKPYLFTLYAATKEYIDKRRKESGNEKEYDGFVTWAKKVGPNSNLAQGATMNTGNIESSTFVKSTKSTPIQINHNLLIPTTANIKSVLGKIDLSVVAASVCACGCSCHVEND